MTDRRTFLTLASAAGLSAAVAACSPRRNEKPAAPAPTALDYDSLTVINTLGFLDNPYGPRGTGTPTDKAIADGHASGVAALNVTLSRDTFEATMANIKAWDAVVAAKPNDLMKVLTTADIATAKAGKKIGLMYGFQNTVMLGDDVGNIDRFHDAGVQIIQLTYNDLNKVGGGSLVPGRVGLTDFGRQVVARLNEKKIIVDLSHSGTQICLDAIAASKQPIAITHTGCKAVADVPRCKTDEELKGVADKGGYVGIFFMPYVAPGRAFNSADVANHIDHAIQVCGEDHVGIGTDHGLVDLGDKELLRADYAKQIAERRAKGISAPGEDPNILPYADDLTGPNQFRHLAEVLSKRGYSNARIEKVMGGNFLRYAKDIWGA